MRLDKLKKRFEVIYKDEQDAIFRYCLLRTSNREVSLDLTQDTFTRFWDYLIDGKEIKNDRAFLFTISRNLIIDYYRKKKSLSLDNILDEASDSTMLISDDNTDTEISAEGRYILEKIDELEPSDRQVVYFRFVEGLKPKDIADILNVSANVVSVRLVRAIDRLRQITGINIEDK